MKRYIVGNLKMNPVSSHDAERYVGSLLAEMSGKRFGETEIVVAPPLVYLDRFASVETGGVALAAQDVFWEDEGPYTGQISPKMLRDVGARYVIVGHSERRTYAHETDSEVGAKVRAALREHIRPIVCVGETAEERDEGLEGDVLGRQVTAALRDVGPTEAERVIVAYEPRWAIGTDRIPDSDAVLEARAVIRRALSFVLGAAVAERIPILYGGSVQASSIGQVCIGPGMDGVLVGRESLHPHALVTMAAMVEGA